MPNLRQHILRWFYPIIRKTGNKDNQFQNEDYIAPVKSIYNLSVTLNTGKVVSLSEFKGRKLILVNTASHCGYTGQYAELETFYKENKESVTCIAFPANNFKGQEPGDDEEIARFCEINYGVTFPIALKSDVVDSAPDSVFRWLTDKNLNGWSDQKPEWNFSKYYVNESGVLMHYFGPGISPMDPYFKNEVLKN